MFPQKSPFYPLFGSFYPLFANQPLSDTQGKSVATFALVTTVGPESRPARSTPGELGRVADRQAFASLSYPTHRQVLGNPHGGRPGFLVSVSTHPRTPVRRGRHAGLLLLLRKSGPELAEWRDNTPRPPLVAGGALLSGGRAAMMPDPVRTQRHRCAVMPSNRLVA